MSTPSGTFTVRWGRLSLVLLGVLSLVAIPVTVAVAAFTSLSWWTPALCLALVVLCVVGLRGAAVRDRRRRAWKLAAQSVPAALVESAARDAAERDAARSVAEADASETALDAAEVAASAEASAVDQKEREAKPVVEDVPFDMLADAPADETVDPRPEATIQAQVAADAATVQDTDAENVDAEDGIEPAAGDAAGPAAPVSSTWEPRELPAPSYVGATPATRPTPEAMPEPAQEPTPTISSIRKAEAQRVAAERAERLNLDAVLQRRRA